MALATSGDGRFGFSVRDEHPAYGSINVANTPTAEEVRKNAQDLKRLEAYRRNLRQEIGTIQAQGATAILVTMPFLSAKYGSGILSRDETTLPIIATQVTRNNEIVRTLGQEFHAPIADAATLTSRPSLFVDDCHFVPAGEAALAALFFETIKPLVVTSARHRPVPG
jgi:lysophospholipase L1-like esterase